jgi:hypothetical protein
VKIFVNHLGFTTDDMQKQAVIHGDEGFTEFAVVDLNKMGYNEIGPNQQENQYALKGKLQSYRTDRGSYFIADFSSLRKAGIYMITINNQYNSVPFQIRDDVYTRTMRKAFGYIHIQRCGQEVSGYHGPCHLDDGIRRDTGEYLDTTGGWHDAGDLRKWMAHSMLLGVGISQIRRRVNPSWYSFNSNENDLLNELRWGNAYFLKMMDSTGRIYNDVAAGIGGDNSDNHWTDNKIGTEDDRYVKTEYHPEVQWEFIYLEAMISDIFKDCDHSYSDKCLDASVKALNFLDEHPEFKVKSNTWTFSYAQAKFTAWSLLAYKELYMATGADCYLQALNSAVKALLDLQEKAYAFNQNRIRGFWYCDSKREKIFKDLRDSGIILISLCEVYPLLEPNSELKNDCGEAIKLYCGDYVTPLVQTNSFGIMPYGLFTEDVTDETYRTVAGDLKYRFFAPTKTPFYLGLTSHLLSHAVGLRMAGVLFKQNNWLNIAQNQVEWVMGRNPQNACLMTGEGINNPYPHSRFLGLIPGGIMNGYVGLEDDEPFLDMNYQMDWRTTEYWSPHTCFYLWYLSLL